MSGIATAWALLALGSGLGLQDSEKAPVPDEAARKEALGLIHDVFREEYRADTPEAKRLLFGLLRKQAKDEGNDADTRYVILREARDVGVEIGAFKEALEVVAWMEREYTIDGLKERQVLLEEAASKASGVDPARELAGEFLDLAMRAFREDRLDAADELAKRAGELARTGKDLPSLATSRKLVKRIASMREIAERAARAGKRLESDPEDAAANGELGEYLAYWKGDWKKGLPHLAKSGDGVIAKLARRDLANPPDSAARLDLADGWWAAAEGAQGDTGREALKERAAHWYRRIEGGLTGLRKIKVEKRLAEVPDRRARFAEVEGSWILLRAPLAFGVEGDDPDGPIRLGSKKGGNEDTLTLDPFPEGDFNRVSMKVRFSGKARSKALLVIEPGSLAVGVEPGPGVWASSFVLDLRTGKTITRASVPTTKEYVLDAEIIAGSWVIRVNDKRIKKLATSLKRIEGLEIRGSGKPLELSDIRLRRKL